MAKETDTRERILDAGAQLFRCRGYEGTSLKETVREGNAPWRSPYHFFPGDKEELGVLALWRSGERYRRLIDLVFERTEDSAQALRHFAELSARA